MEAELALSVRRDDVDALYRLQSDAWECWVGERDGELVGMGTLLVRDGYLGGERARIGYLGDLRVTPSLGGFRLLTRLYGPILRDAAERHGCDVFLTAVLESNGRAMRALTSERARRHGIPAYVPLCSFSIRTVQLPFPRLPRRASAYAVATAAEDDVPELARFLDGDGRRRPCGYVLDEEELRRRLRSWPGLSLRRFFLARDRSGALAGCLAVWDPRAVKRTVVEAYRGRMRAARLAHDAAASLLRFPRLPAPRGELRYAYATHQAVPSDDPAVLRALLGAARSELRGELPFLSCWVPDGDPLAPAFRGFRSTDLRAVLYAVAPPGRELPDACFAPGRPGFEMALV